MAKKKKTPKTHERHAFGLSILKASHPRIRQLKKDHEPELHGDKFWGSSYLLMDFLQHQGLAQATRVTEVGCGWGLAGIYCAREFGAQVTGVDADPKVFPYLHLHAEVNEVTVRTRTGRFENLKKKQLAEEDLIVGADICFWDKMAGSLYKLIRKAIRAGVQQVVVADPGRPPFDEVCELCQKELGGEVKEWRVAEPKAHGWLLVVGSLPMPRG